MTINTCDADQCQLFVSDIQEKLAAAMPNDCVGEMYANTSRLLQAAKALGIPAHITEQYPKGLGPTQQALLDQLPSDTEVIEKTCFSACGANKIADRLREQDRKQVVICGVETHICVLQTCADLLDAGYEVHVAADAVCSRSEAKRRNALSRMARGGAVITNTESVVFEWLRDAAHPAFKQLSGLFR